MTKDAIATMDRKMPHQPVEDMFVHRLAVFGDTPSVNEITASLVRRATTAWGPSDMLFRRMRLAAGYGEDPRRMRTLVDRALRSESGYSLAEVMEEMDPADQGDIEDDARLEARVSAAGEAQAQDDYTIESGRPGLSLAACCPVPHSVAQWGLEPVGRMWRRDNWGTDTDILSFSPEFGRHHTAGRDVRVIEFAACSAMPNAAFLRLSRSRRDVIFVVTGQMASVGNFALSARRGGALQCAVYACAAGEDVSSEIIDMAGSLEICRSVASDPEGSVRSILRGIEERFISRFDMD